MTTPAMPELLREIVAYCREAGHDWASLAEADHMLAAISSQQSTQGDTPSPELAGVSDEELDRLDMAAQEKANQNPHGTLFHWRRVYLRAFARATHALRPTQQAVPMTDEQANGYWKIAAKASSRYSPAEAYYKGIADTEAHHGITQRADGGEG